MKQLNVYFRILSFIILTLILSIGFFIAPARAEWADHLVISAVQITEGEGKTNHDFIEIYNPTLNDINLKGYRLVKRTKTGASDTSIKSWTDDAVIKPHGWRLWASSDDEAYSLGVGADDATKQTIAPDNGIAVRFGALDTGAVIDAVAWGAAENIFKESAAPANPGPGEKLVRKPAGTDMGNGEDTNNNASDFIVTTNFIPHNLKSISAPAIDDTSNSGSVAVPDSNPGSQSATDISVIQQSFPVAEAGEDKNAVIGENLDFDGSDSYDPKGKELVYNWNFGDDATAKGENVSHAYKSAGDYKVTLKVDNGENAKEDSLLVKVVEPEFSDKIILSEILPNPLGADKDGEWVEIFNFGEKKVNLRGWILTSGAKTSGKRYQFSGDNFIEPKSFLIVRRSESGLVLTNESGLVSLVWPPDKILSEVSYGPVKEGKSYAFIDNAWVWTDSPTPGKENLFKTSAPKSSIKKDDGDSFLKIAAETGAKENSVKAESENEKNTIAGSAINSKSYSDILISETGAEEAASGENISAQAESEKKQEILGNNGNLVRDNSDSEKDKIFKSDREDARNNPWFWGDIMLSILSLFLVWRYQEIRKKIKN